MANLDDFYRYEKIKEVIKDLAKIIDLHTSRIRKLESDQADLLTQIFILTEQVSTLRGQTRNTQDNLVELFPINKEK